MKAEEYFPFDEYRPGQLEALKAIERAFEKGFKYVTLNAPTGSGKSPLAMAFAHEAASRGLSTNVLTVQKILQDQYSSDFTDIFALKGRAGYLCNHINAAPGDSCADGPCCLNKELRGSKTCSYNIAKGQAVQYPTIVHNFHSYYYQTMASMYHLRQRDLLIIDEAHNIEQVCLDFISFSLSNRKRPFEIPEYKTIGEYDSLVMKEMKDSRLRVSKLESTPTLDKNEMTEMEDLTRFIARATDYINTRSKIEYVFEYADHRNYQSVTFKPVLVGDFVLNNLFSGPKRILMMSATLLDKEQFCKSIGLDPDEVYHVDIPNFFPAENRPIIKKYVGSMSYRSINETLPDMVGVIETILARFPNCRGIIHTVSEKNAQYVKMNCYNDRLTFRKDYPTVKEMLEVHKRKHGSIIVASGLREGLNLEDDLGKIQILMKVPYMSLGDKRVKVRMKLDKNWYGYMSTLAFVQTIGRCVRSETDKAATFLLDSDFGRFFGMNKRFIPKYIHEAIKK